MKLDALRKQFRAKVFVPFMVPGPGRTLQQIEAFKKACALLVDEDGKIVMADMLAAATAHLQPTE